jgi:GTP-binding protein
MKRFYEEFQLAGAPLRLNFDQKLTLRKDEDLEQFALSSNSVSSGLHSDSSMGRKNNTRNRHPSLRQQERRAHKRF